MKRLTAAGEQFALGTLVDTRGSTPQKAGARLLVRADGSTLGTLGGGCVEAEAWQAAQDALTSGHAADARVRADRRYRGRLRFGVRRQRAHPRCAERTRVRGTGADRGAPRRRGHEAPWCARDRRRRLVAGVRFDACGLGRRRDARRSRHRDGRRDIGRARRDRRGAAAAATRATGRMVRSCSSSRWRRRRKSSSSAAGMSDARSRRRRSSSATPSLSSTTGRTSRAASASRKPMRSSSATSSRRCWSIRRRRAARSSSSRAGTSGTTRRCRQARVRRRSTSA